MDNDYDSEPGWWTDKPERHDRSTFFAPIHGPLGEKAERGWIKMAVVVLIMLVFGMSLLQLLG